MATFRLLSIDGGGIRGLVPALILQHIEERTDCRICELFDVIAGTSTGGILALGLTGEGPKSASEIVALYKNEGPRIFSKPPFWKTLDSVVDHVPGARALEHALGFPHEEICTTWSCPSTRPRAEPRRCVRTFAMSS